MSETLIVALVCRKILFGRSAQTYFRLRSAWGSQIGRNSTFNFCDKLVKIKPCRLSKQLDSVTENPFVFCCYKVSHVIGQNTHSRNIFSVHGFLNLSINLWFKANRSFLLGHLLLQLLKEMISSWKRNTRSLENIKV